jgi:hypothetical protein
MKTKSFASTFAVGLLLLVGTPETADAFDVSAAKSRIDGVLAKDYPYLERSIRTFTAIPSSVSRRCGRPPFLPRRCGISASR